MVFEIEVWSHVTSFAADISGHVNIGSHNCLYFRLPMSSYRYYRCFPSRSLHKYILQRTVRVICQAGAQ